MLTLISKSKESLEHTERKTAWRYAAGSVSAEDWANILSLANLVSESSSVGVGFFEDDSVRFVAEQGLPVMSLTRSAFTRPAKFPLTTYESHEAFPIIFQNGETIGVLVIVDLQKVEWTHYQKKMWRMQAMQIATLLQVTSAHTESEMLEKQLERQELMINELQYKLIQNAKLASLGELAASIAHEINNPLSVIAARSQITLQRLEQRRLTTEKLTETLHIIDSTTMRISRIVNGLRTFSRTKNVEDCSAIDVKAMILEVAGLLSERCRLLEVNFDINLPDSQVSIEASSVQLGQVIINILGNAIQAVKDTEEKRIAIELKVESEYVTIDISDSGMGVPEELTAKIMEPFFTTKPAGEGTGLGLSISKGIIEKHGGELTLFHARKPTIFRLKLLKKIPEAVTPGTLTLTRSA